MDHIFIIPSVAAQFHSLSVPFIVYLIIRVFILSLQIKYFFLILVVANTSGVIINLQLVIRIIWTKLLGRRRNLFRSQLLCEQHLLRRRLHGMNRAFRLSFPHVRRMPCKTYLVIAGLLRLCFPPGLLSNDMV